MNFPTQVVLGLQVGTFLWLGMHFLLSGEWRLGVSQLLLAAVQGIIYSGSMQT